MARVIGEFHLRLGAARYTATHMLYVFVTTSCCNWEGYLNNLPDTLKKIIHRLLPPEVISGTEQSF